MRNAFTILLIPALLLLGSLTAFAGDGSLPYNPVTEPPIISSGPAPTIPVDNRDRMAFRNEIQVPAASQETLPSVKPVAPSVESPWHNHGAH